MKCWRDTQLWQAHRLAPFYRTLPAFFRSAVVERAAARLPASPRYLAFDFLLRRFVLGADAPPGANIRC